MDFTNCEFVYGLKDVYLCNGSEHEYQQMMQVIDATNTIRSLTMETNPDSFLAYHSQKMLLVLKIKRSYVHRTNRLQDQQIIG